MIACIEDKTMPSKPWRVNTFTYTTAHRDIHISPEYFIYLFIDFSVSSMIFSALVFTYSISCHSALQSHNARFRDHSPKHTIIP